MSLTAAQQDMRDWAVELLSFEEFLLPSEFAEKYIELPPGKNETKPGKIDFDEVPYLVEPLNALVDPDVQDVVEVMPTRSGKTMLLRLAVGYFIGYDPCPMVWYDATESNGAIVSETEIRPLIDFNPRLSKHVPKKNRKNLYTNKKMLLGAASLLFRGAQNERQAGGITARIVFGNEADKWRGKGGKEAALIDLTKERSKSFGDQRRNVFSSTPSLEDGPIWQEYLRGDQRKFYVPCPHCGHLQQLEWGDQHTPHGVKWDKEAKIDRDTWDLEKVMSSVYYQCEKNKCKITEVDRLKMISDKGSEWRPTNLRGEPHFRSYHINGLYVRVNSLPQLVVQFLRGRESGMHTDKQHFWNSTMGMPWKQEISSISAEKMKHLEKPYLRGELPKGWKADVIIIGADEQTWGKPWVVRGYQWNGESYVIDHGVAASYEDLDQVQADYRAKYLIIDTNFEKMRSHTMEAIFTRRNKGWLGAEGFETAKKEVTPEQTNAFMGGTKEKHNLLVWKLKISNYHMKTELHHRWGATEANRNWFTYSVGESPSPEELKEQQDYYAQLLDERLVRVKVGGKMVDKWRSRAGNNHFFDCEVYAFAMFRYLQIKQTTKRRKSGKRKPLQVGSMT